ncbi:hypothetical protein COCMIDRAFT_92512 [Bipolaris oryzae ATCC 44560]|uniref:Uncharacterized protein n=1 Tax=Bipolaris oryzae ATCC 44560 TaxID=930090 RepID=W6Z9V1_COCMI|nr:uncharacterized protein COCMIDRAFT_92512 [Bipolaris oryzae ATCC 44560]EUC46558.1 hypothetical protein COCMIDRAFT_92512 [Bipolaris oryzae ATCC 44560]
MKAQRTNCIRPEGYRRTRPRQPSGTKPHALLFPSIVNRLCHSHDIHWFQGRLRNLGAEVPRVCMWLCKACQALLVGLSAHFCQDWSLRTA